MNVTIIALGFVIMLIGIFVIVRGFSQQWTATQPPEPTPQEQSVTPTPQVVMQPTPTQQPITTYLEPIENITVLNEIENVTVIPLEP